MDRQEEFKQRLLALLREYDVEMSVEESSRGYYTVAEGINFFSYAKYEDGEIVAESIDFTLGTWENGK